MAIYNAEAFIQKAKSVLDKYAWHWNRPNELDQVPEKSPTDGDDLVLIEDSKDGFSKKKVRLSNFVAGSLDVTAVHKNTPNEFSGIPTKASPVGTDKLLIEDSEDNNSKKVVDMSALPTPAHSHTIADVANLQTELDGKEPAFTKNTAFNRDFGTGNQDVARGDHNHDGVYSPVSHDHSGVYSPVGHDHNADYAALSHPHAISDVTNLQASLDAKVETSSNTGTGEGIALPVNGTDLPFKSLVAGNNITLTSGTDTITIESTGGGTSDHGALTGLGDDDHPQYHNDARGDARYSQLGHNHDSDYAPVSHDHNGVYEPVFAKNTGFNLNLGTGAGEVAEGNHNHDSDYAPVAHTHAVADVAGLQASLDAKIETSSNVGAGESIALPANGTDLPFKTLVAGNNITLTPGADTITIESTGGSGGTSDHGALSGLGDDDHPQYHNDARGDARYSQLGHNHDTDYAPISHDHNGVYEPVFSKNTGFNLNLGTNAGEVAEGNHLHTGVYAPATHTHTVADVTGLQSSLDTKVETSSNAGSGEGIALPVNGTDLPFKSLVAGSNITLTSGTDTITIDSTAAGVTDHGALTGLGDDDHPQYHNDARGDARYSQLGHNHDTDYAPIGHDHNGVYEPVFSKNTGFNLNLGTGAGEVAEGNHLHTGVYAPAAHTHTVADVTGLQASLDSKVETSSNAGTGVGLALPKNGVDLPFKTLVAGSGINITDGTETITIDSPYAAPLITLHDTGTNLFPVYTDTYRGGKTLSTETTKVTFRRNGAVTNPYTVQYVQSVDWYQGYQNHIQMTICAVSVAFESADTTGSQVDLEIVDAVSDNIIHSIPAIATTNGANRVYSDVLTVDFDLPVNSNIQTRVTSPSGGSRTDVTVELYVRWRF